MKQYWKTHTTTKEIYGSAAMPEDFLFVKNINITYCT
jgi:hypothetical protein